jgi:hypothetical protein
MSRAARSTGHPVTTESEWPASQARNERHAAEIATDAHRAECDEAHDDLIRAGWSEAEILAGRKN